MTMTGNTHCIAKVLVLITIGHEFKQIFSALVSGQIFRFLSLLAPVPGCVAAPDYGGYPGRTLLKGVVPLRVLDVGTGQGY